MQYYIKEFILCLAIERMENELKKIEANNGKENFKLYTKKHVIRRTIAETKKELEECRKAGEARAKLR